jgi:hypothetical protein
LSLLKVTSPRVTSTGACSKTLRNRTIEVGSHRELTSGRCAAQQLADELKALPQEERKELLATGVFSGPSTVLSPENALALKADLAIPWNKLRAMRRYSQKSNYILYIHVKIHKRWMKVWGIQIASEKQLRRVSDEQLGDNLEGEEAPFCFAARNGFDIRQAPLVYVPDLVGKIIQTLEQNEK